MSNIEVIIIGAGWCGLVAAKTYLQTKPDARLLIVDSESTLGGVWSKERLYPHLFAEAHHGLFEFSDLPMKDETHKAHTAGLIRGESVHQYLNSYATEFDLHKNLRLNSKVLSASRQDRQWRIALQDDAEHLTSDKLIIATGLTSEAFVPEIDNKGFNGSIIHSKELGKREVYERVSSESIRSVVVYGGSKSSFDAVNLLLRAGKHVHWIVRPGKGGPSIMTPLRILGSPSFYLNNSRFLAMFSPNLFSKEATTRWLHQTGPAWITQPIVRGFWKLITFLLMGEAQYGKSENSKLLKPVMGLDSLLWSPATLGVMTHPDLWKDIHEGTKVHVHESSIEMLNDKHVELANGHKVEADMVVFCTGWKSLAKNYIFSEDDCLKAGLPSPKSFDSKTKQKWLGLRQQSDARVTGLMPLLSDSPGWKDHHPRLEDDFHLYQSIVPATSNEEDDRSLAYIGFLRTTGAPVVYEAQALWAAAYLQGKLEVPSKEERERRTAELNAWVRRRYLCGRKVPFAMFDFLPYVDMLYRDLGVNSYRKSNPLSEIFGLYTPSDFKGVVDEWMSETHVGQSGSGLFPSWTATIVLFMALLICIASLMLFFPQR